jgi:phage-related protein
VASREGARVHPVSVSKQHPRFWRDYRTAAGARVFRDAVMEVPSADRAAIAAAMLEVRAEGLRAARHLRGDLYEVDADGRDVTYRVVFATDGRHGQVLLALHLLNKKTRKTPPRVIDLAETRLNAWRGRGVRSPDG